MICTVNPKVDVAFKKLFGVEENKDLLISLINSIISPEEKVADITLLNPYNPINFKYDKLSILDIKALGVNGCRFNIEIQITDEADYDKRALYYWAKLYSEQLKKGDDYTLLNKAIGIHILNFISITETDKYHNVFRITGDNTGVIYFKDLELHTIELKKFISSDVNSKFSDLMLSIKNSLDLWVAFLARYDLLHVGGDKLDKLNNLQNLENLPKIKKALNVMEVMNFNDEELMAYEDHLKWLRIEASSLKKAEEKGKAEGKLEGIAEGKAQGIVEGLAKGKLEEKKQNILNMLQIGLKIELISEIMQLSITEIEKLAIDCNYEVPLSAQKEV